MADTPDLSQLDARLTRMEAQLGRLTELLDQAMPAIAMGIDIVDEEVAAAQARGVDVDARLRAAAELLERASEPAALDALGRMVAQA